MTGPSDPPAAPAPSSSSPPPAPPASSAALTPAAFREAVGQFVTGITVVATTAGGVTHAMTVSSFTSVSLDPLLILVCVVQASGAVDADQDEQRVERHRGERADRDRKSVV